MPRTSLTTYFSPNTIAEYIMVLRLLAFGKLVIALLIISFGGGLLVSQVETMDHYVIICVCCICAGAFILAECILGLSLFNCNSFLDGSAPACRLYILVFYIGLNILTIMTACFTVCGGAIAVNMVKKSEKNVGYAMASMLLIVSFVAIVASLATLRFNIHLFGRLRKKPNFNVITQQQNDEEQQNAGVFRMITLAEHLTLSIQSLQENIQRMRQTTQTRQDEQLSRDIQIPGTAQLPQIAILVSEVPGTGVECDRQDTYELYELMVPPESDFSSNYSHMPSVPPPPYSQETEDFIIIDGATWN